jgi:adhesin/invasin
VQAYAAGEPATSSQGAVTLAASLGTVGPVTDRGNGTYVATFTAGTTAGTAEISGTIAGAPIGEGTSIVLNAAPATTGGT